MAEVAMQQAPLAPTDENVAPSNIAAVNPLLAGACDDDDNELTEAQKAIIEEKLRALQARFKAFEEKTLKQKIDELVMANEGLTNAEAEMTLKVCGGNEFEASDRLSNEDEDHEQFRKSIKRMVQTEQRSAHLGVKARAKVELTLAKKRKRLARRRDDYADDDDDERSDPESDWEESEYEDEPLEIDEPLQEVQFGVRFVRHKKSHKVGGRLKLDDALANLAAAQAAQAAAQKKAEEDAANGGVAEGGAEEGCGSEGAGGDAAGAAADGTAAEGNTAGANALAGAGAAQRLIDDLMDGWSDARKKAWSNRLKNENQYYYRFNEPGEPQAEGKWTSAQHQLFMETLESVRSGAAGYPMYQWGSFSKNIPGRVGYQCSNYYRTLIKNGDVVDSNYMVDESGQMRFNFKNKGFERVNKETGDTEVLAAKPKKVYVPKPKKIKAPKPLPKPKPKKAKKAKDDDRDDRAFRCSVKFDSTRRSGRNAGSTKKYADGDGDGESGDDEDETPVLPNFVDPLTKMQIQEPAISPYGHVAGYETWCRVLRAEDGKDTCPFTRQPLRRRDLMKLTHENLAEYRGKMVDTQNA
jgi:hypothetical protein